VLRPSVGEGGKQKTEGDENGNMGCSGVDPPSFCQFAPAEAWRDALRLTG
jgi:hypothetical protein